MTDRVHYLTIEPEWADDALALRLVHPDIAGAPCRLRPPDDRERWSCDDPDLIDGDCWAVDFIDAAGWAVGVRTAVGVTWPRIPVDVTYDEGVIITPLPGPDTEPTLQYDDTEETNHE